MGPELLDGLTRSAIQSLAEGAAPSPSVLCFLLRSYARTGRDDVREALGGALAEGVALSASAADLDVQARWTAVFVDAAGLSDDERLRAMATDLTARQRARWAVPSDAPLAPRMRSIEACLRAAALDTSGDPSAALSASIDELERLAGLQYRPGRGMEPVAADEADVEGPPRLDDQIASGLALLAAFQACGRLPYAMLAEELVQLAHHSRWSDARGLFVDGSPGEFVTNSEAAVLLGSLGQLHEDSDYVRAVVVAPDAQYEADAERVLTALAATFSSQVLPDAAVYGVALHDWLMRRHGTAGQFG